MLGVDIERDGKADELTTTPSSCSIRHNHSSSGHKSSKSWLIGKPCKYDSMSTNSDESNMRIVQCTTNFTTALSIIIAIILIPLYIITGAAVVRTAALDAIGDIVSSFIALYTNRKMSTPEPKKYPVGQSKFQSIGCLVFSTFMFAIFFGNALGNLEALVQGPDDIGYMAISRFFHHAGEDLGNDFAAWHAEVTQSGNGYEWVADGKELRNPLRSYFLNHGDSLEKEMALSMDATATRQSIVKQAAEYENYGELHANLIKQNSFLTCLGICKVLLWAYCVFYAIPRTGSSVLAALATDKKHDFIGTFACVISTSFAFSFRGSLPMEESKVDPLVALCLSFFFMYSWSESMCEHMQILSQEAASDDICEQVRSDVHKAVEGSPCIARDDDIKVYLSSEKHTVETILRVTERDAYFRDVSTAMLSVRHALDKEDVERVLVFAQAASTSDGMV